MKEQQEDFAIETRQLSKRYGRQLAVERIELHIPRGSIYGLLGPNGAGKTTTLKLLTGLLRPTQGCIYVFGEPWRRAHLWRIGALIETPSIYGNLTGAENLEVHRRLLGLPRERIGQVLKQVGLLEADKKLAAHYSLGMKQRLGIALALLGSPELLILDEPTNGLDPIGIQEMRQLIHSFNDQGITVILSSHILHEVAQIASHVGIISGGRLLYQDRLDDREGLEELFMKIVGSVSIIN